MTTAAPKLTLAQRLARLLFPKPRTTETTSAAKRRADREARPTRYLKVHPLRANPDTKAVKMGLEPAFFSDNRAARRARRVANRAAIIADSKLRKPKSEIGAELRKARVMQRRNNWVLILLGRIQRNAERNYSHRSPCRDNSDFLSREGLRALGAMA